jgi:osmotically-inducible protein OsmY
MRLHRFAVCFLLLAGVVGCDRLQSSSAGAADEDSASTRALALRVKLELLQKLGTDALRIDVDNEGGEVRLAGEVKKRSTAELAEDITKKVSGVTAVANDLQVAGEPAPTASTDAFVAEAEREVSDAALEVRVRLALVDRLGSDGFRIGTDAASGVVTLEFPAAFERARRRDAMATAEKVKGVEKVVALDKD